MNPLLQQALGSIVRHLLTGVAMYIVGRGVWTEEEATTYVSAATLALLGLSWSLWQKYKERVKLLTALSIPAPTTEEKLDRVVATGATPPVLTPTDEVPTVPPV